MFFFLPPSMSFLVVVATSYAYLYTYETSMYMYMYTCTWSLCDVPSLPLPPSLQVCIRVVEGERYSQWSAKFSLEALGSEGFFSCNFKDSAREFQVQFIYTVFRILYRDVLSISGRPGFKLDVPISGHCCEVMIYSPQIGTKVELSRFGTTRTLTLSPFYMINNTTRVGVGVTATSVSRVSLLFRQLTLYLLSLDSEPSLYPLHRFIASFYCAWVGNIRSSFFPVLLKVSRPCMHCPHN